MERDHNAKKHFSLDHLPRFGGLCTGHNYARTHHPCDLHAHSRREQYTPGDANTDEPTYLHCYACDGDNLNTWSVRYAWSLYNSIRLCRSDGKS